MCGVDSNQSSEKGTMPKTSVVARVAVNDVDSIHAKSVVKEASVRNSTSAICSSSDEEVLPIEVDATAEDTVALVDSMANWVGRQQWIAINKSTIIDIASMSAVASIISSSINDYLVTIIGKVAGNIEFISKTRGAESRRSRSTYFTDNTNVYCTMIVMAHLMGNGVCMFNVMVNNVLVMNIMVNKMFMMNIMVHMMKMVHMMVYFVMMSYFMINVVNMVYGLMGRMVALSLVISIGLSNHTRTVAQLNMTTSCDMRTAPSNAETRQEGSREAIHHSEVIK